jgi:small subunit ribosomal protein S3
LGQKSNPIGLRLGINKTSSSIWFDEKNFSERIKEDMLIRKYVYNQYQSASISQIEIKRTSNRASVTVSTSRPGLIIGKGGVEVDSLKRKLKKLVGYDVHVNVFEIKRPGLVSKLVGQSISQQLEKKVNYRRAVKKAIQSTMGLGAAGIRVCISGRLNGAEIARSETFREGRVPLHTLRANIDYAIVEAHTTYGIIGIKVWIFNEKGN